MHWLLALILSIATAGVFAGLWALVIGAWLKRVRPQSSALALYLIFDVLGAALLVSILLPQRVHLVAWLPVFAVVVWIIASFVMRDDLMIHFNGDEPVGLSLGIWATLFGSIYYFQSHLSAIARLKRELRESAG